MIARLCRWIFTKWGWQLTGKIPHHLKKKIYIVMPHTSNWDFPIGILMKFGYGMDVQFIAKNSLFAPPFGWIFRKLGGIPVDRSKSNNFVDNMVQTLQKYDRISIALAPEGTRKKVTNLKSGFYWISYKSGIPLIFVSFDWKNKIVDYYETPFMPTGDYEGDVKIIENHFKNVEGRIPKNSIYHQSSAT